MTTITFNETYDTTPLCNLIREERGMDIQAAEIVREKTLRVLETLYHRPDFTVREICELYGADYNNNIQKMFFRLFGPKGVGLGGARKGSGNKKEWNKIKKTHSHH